jgi:uncharacterized membrane protein
MSSAAKDTSLPRTYYAIVGAAYVIVAAGYVFVGAGLRARPDVSLWADLWRYFNLTVASSTNSFTAAHSAV